MPDASLRTAIRSFAIAVLAVGMLGAGPLRPAHAFWFDYQKPPPPVGGDCDAIAGEIGRAATWYGEFSGNYYDDFTDYKYPYSARGCFRSEYECRVWQNDAISYTGRGGIIAM